jgi:hypothetical protein
MMRFNVTQPISHQSKMGMNWRTQKLEAQSDEAQEHDAERPAKSCDQYPAVAEYHTSEARSQARLLAAVHELSGKSMSGACANRVGQSARPRSRSLIADGLAATLKVHRARPPMRTT